LGDLTAGALKIARVAVDSRVGTKNMTAAALESIDESEFRAQGKIEDNRLTVYLWGNADQRGRSLFDSFLEGVDRESVAASVKEVVVDFRELMFMNSACLKSLVTWLRRVQERPADRQYAIRFLQAADAHWQVRSFSALVAFGRGVLTVE
jgi:hypothetical protein